MIRINPSALSQTLTTQGYTANDVLKLGMEQKRQDKLISEARQNAILDKIYDAGVGIQANDYGLYNEEIQSMYAEASKKAASDIKAGKSPTETLQYYTPFTNTVSKANSLHQDENKFAAYIDANRLLSVEQKKQAIDDRKKLVFYNEDGTKRTPEEAAKMSKETVINTGQYIDNESVYQDFLKNSKQTNRSDREGMGISTKMLYPWQTEKDGKIVVNQGDDGLVTEEVYAAWMSDSERASQAEYQAKKALPGETDQGVIDTYKRKHVTDILLSHGDEGAQKTWSAMPSGYFKSGTTKKTIPFNFFAPFNNVSAYQLPTKNDPELQKTFVNGKTVMAKDAYQLISGLGNTGVKGLRVTPDGTWYAYKNKDIMGLSQEWVKYDDANMLMYGLSKDVGNAWYQYNLEKGIDTNPANSPSNTTQPSANGAPWANGISAPQVTTQTKPNNPVVNETVTYTIADYPKGTVTNIGEIEEVKDMGKGKIRVSITGKDAYKVYNSYAEFQKEAGEPKSKVGSSWK